MPCRALPVDLLEKAQSEAFGARRQALEDQLRQAPYKPREDDTLFTTLWHPTEEQLIMIAPGKSDGACLPLFSTPFRAADYARILLTSIRRVRFQSFDSLVGARMLSGPAAPGGAVYATLDPCPRCGQCVRFRCQSICTPEALLKVWAIGTGTDGAMADLDFEYALEAARKGALETAREVSLESVGHNTAEDPRFHLLLGQVAVALRDSTLLGEAKAFLRFLGAEPWARKLDESVQSGSPDFRGPAWTGTPRGSSPTSGWN
jgi:hypothetical protein